MAKRYVREGLEKGVPPPQPWPSPGSRANPPLSNLVEMGGVSRCEVPPSLWTRIRRWWVRRALGGGR